MRIHWALLFLIFLLRMCCILRVSWDWRSCWVTELNWTELKVLHDVLCTNNLQETMWGILVLRCYDKICVLNNRNLSVTFLETGEAKFKVPANYVPDESPLFSLQVIIFLLYPHMAERGERERQRSQVSSSAFKGTNPIMASLVAQW